MKVALLGNSASIHCVRWANGLVSRGVDVVMISSHPGVEGFDPAVDLRVLSAHPPVGYITGAGQLREILIETKPDILNAHYGTGYGLLARLAAFRPLMLSVWGADVYDFPRKSPMHTWLLRGNIEAADAIGSTSECMARETSRISNARPIYVTPFGVDTQLFYPATKPADLHDCVVVGTVKSLSSKYGIDSLIQAFAQVWCALGRPMGLRLEIGGGGEDRESLGRLCEQLGIAGQVHFHGQVPHSEVPKLIHRMDIFVALSRLDSESFGVAAVEASACGRPVLVSDAQGLAEVTIDAVTGIVVGKNDPLAAAAALRRLVEDADLRRRMGAAGRGHVVKTYSWDMSLDIMLNTYYRILEKG